MAFRAVISLFALGIVCGLLITGTNAGGSNNACQGYKNCQTVNCGNNTNTGVVVVSTKGTNIANCNQLLSGTNGGVNLLTVILNILNGGTCNPGLVTQLPVPVGALNSGNTAYYCCSALGAADCSSGDKTCSDQCIQSGTGNGCENGDKCCAYKCQ